MLKTHSIMDDKINKSKHRTSFKNLLVLAFPVILSMLSLNVMQFFDRIFLARFDMKHFAASFPAGIISFTFVSIFLGIAFYVKDMVSQFYGAKKNQECAASSWQGIYFSIFTGIIIIASYPLSSKIFVLAGHDPALVPLEKNYFFWMLISGSITILAQALIGFFYGTSNTKVSMIANVFANISNIFFNWVLIFGKFGFPALGITGAGIGTTIGQVVCLLILLSVFFSKKYKNKFNTHTLFKINFKIIEKLIYFGIPSGIAYFLDVGQWGLFIMLLGKLGEKALAAANMSIALESISFLPIIGLAAGTSIITGQEKGTGKLHNIKKILLKSFFIAFLYDILILVFFVGIPGFLILIFKSDQNALYFNDIKNITTILIRITGFWLFMDAVRIILTHVLRSLGDAYFLMIVTLMGGASLTISEYIIINYFNMGLKALWFLIISYTFIMSITLLTRFLSGKWETIKVI